MRLWISGRISSSKNRFSRTLWSGSFGDAGAPLKRRSSTLIAVVGVDVEAEYRVYFDWLDAAHGGAGISNAQGGYDLNRHRGGAGSGDLQIPQVAGGVEPAFDYDAVVGKVRGQFGAHALRADDCPLPTRGGIHLGELHHYRADRRIHVNGVVVAGELAVEIESSAGARCGDDGNGR